MRLKGLDGLRAMSIIAVVAGHMLLRNRNVALAKVGAPLGSLGVQVFFVISGCLISSLLLRELEQTGRVRLGLFYARRALRLWPALWVYVAVVAILGACGYFSVSGASVVSALAFVADYRYPDSPVLLHMWSLAVEEQFYLIWPPLLLWLGVRRGLRWSLIAFLAAPVVRVAGYVVLSRHGHIYDFGLHNRYDGLAAGCALALAWRTPSCGIWLNRVLRMTWQPWLGLLVGLIGDTYGGRPWTLTVGYSLEATAAALLVHQAVNGRHSWLDHAVLGQLGKRSYSLYLWQQPFTLAAVGSFALQPVLGLLAALACAAASYQFVEQPFNRLRRQLHPETRAQRTRGRRIGR